MSFPLDPSLHEHGLDWPAVTRYLAGTASAEESARVHAWLGDDLSRRRQLDFLRTIWRESAQVGEAPPAQGAERMLAQGMAPRAVRGGKVTRRQGMFSTPSLRAAMGLVSLSILGSLVVLMWSSAIRSVRELPKQQYTTRVGQRLLVTLTDGSTMLLAPSTTVTKTSNVVTVIGEAYFAVAPNASRAIRVQTGNAAVQILGTRFLIRQYSGEPVSRVVVEEGRIALRSRSRGDVRHELALVSPRMLAQVSDSGILVTADVDPQKYLAWTRGLLVFKGVPLHDVIAELSRVYGVNIRVADSALAREPISTELDVFRKPLTQVLLIVGETMDARYEQHGNVFVLYPGRRGADVPPVKSDPLYSSQPEKQYGR